MSVKPPTVCMISGAYPPARCGVGDYTSELCRNLTAAGVKVTVLTSSYLGTRRDEGDPTVLPVVSSWSLIHALKTLRTILRIPFDVCHFQMPSQEYRRRLWPFLLVPLVKMLNRSSRIIVTFHELPPVEFRKNLVLGAVRFLRVWLCLLGADAVIAVAEDYPKELTASFRLARQIPLAVIPIASNIPVSIKIPEQLAQLRADLGIKPGCIVLAYFGFINPPKGFENALEVVASFARHGKDAKLLVLGELCSENPYHAAILRLVAEKQLGKHITILGFLDRIAVADLLAAADVCLLPFRNGLEAKNGSFLAALAQGTFIVTTSFRQRGFDEKNNVYYAKPDDVADMTEAVSRYAGRKIPPTMSHHSWPSIAGQHVSLYNNLLARSRERESDACSVRA